MTLRRHFLRQSNSNEKPLEFTGGSYVVCWYSGLGVSDSFLNSDFSYGSDCIAGCDEGVKNFLSGRGISVSQILPEELTREEVLLVALTDLQNRAVRLLGAVDMFAGVCEGGRDISSERVLLEPCLYESLQGMNETEKRDYRLLYNTACALASAAESVEGLLSRVSTRSCGICSSCGRCGVDCCGELRVSPHVVYFVSDFPEGEKVV